ncbi:sensor domain-containing diguanylate cyclase [Psychromonas ossibalaenae]|uniref:sensor domain-containing diguanylate cyclase n=1 Tax=Psychromonas ossibalaenae TaxID=444922 RepID=UPI00037F5F4C|nr:diguanylate cyclase [Psychromonas ossibalaenae]
MSTSIELKDIHWLIDMVQNIDVGLVIIDLDMNVKVWNGFMENHSGLLTSHVVDRKLVDLFGDIPSDWLQQKINSVCLLKNKAFTTWEQRPYLFKFKSYRPITSSAEFMYQNVTFLPLTDIVGKVTQICMIIYDVTDVAINRQAFEEANRKLEHLSHTDTLTQLNNQGYWRECCQQEYKRHTRTQQPSSLIMLDIDHFKQVNDTYGHPFGDEVIREVANCLRKNMRETDIAGRYGGEEFTLILVDTDLKSAQLVAERVRESIESSEFQYQGKEVKITASIGIAHITGNIPDYQTWIKTADLGLYIAKDSGRNQIGISEH